MRKLQIKTLSAMIYLFVILGILSCSLSQLLLKKSAKVGHSSKVYEVLNPMVIIAYAVFFCSLLVNIWAMSQGIQLKEMAMLESLGYVFVPILSFLILKEKISRRTICATLMVVLGIFVFYL